MLLTSFQFSFDGVQSDHQNNSGKTSIVESEAYWQVKNCLGKRMSEYPKTTRYVDAFSLPLKRVSLRKNSVLCHIPLVPGQTKAWDPSQRPGAVRAYFYPEDPWDFDVLYHDPRKPQHPESGQHEYSLASYHQDVTE